MSSFIKTPSATSGPEDFWDYFDFEFVIELANFEGPFFILSRSLVGFDGSHGTVSVLWAKLTNWQLSVERLFVSNWRLMIYATKFLLHFFKLPCLSSKDRRKLILPLQRVFFIVFCTNTIYSCSFRTNFTEIVLANLHVQTGQIVSLSSSSFQPFDYLTVCSQALNKIWRLKKKSNKLPN